MISRMLWGLELAFLVKNLHNFIKNFINRFRSIYFLDFPHFFIQVYNWLCWLKIGLNSLFQALSVVITSATTFSPLKTSFNTDLIITVKKQNNIARTWKQPRCPSADEWIRKLWYIYTVEYYSAIKKNSFESVLMRWTKLEPIIQNEVSQKDKEHYNILTHICGI